MSNPPALSLRGLTKRYDDGVLALDEFELEVPDGEFFGLLGPNGAGKTTLISAVCNLIRITAGEIDVFGHPHHTLDARRLIGLAEQDVNLDRFLDVQETLVYHGGYYGMSRAEARRRASSAEWGCPKTSISPAVTRTRLQTALISVVLPAPLGPSSPKNSPSGTSRSNPSRASTPSS